MQDLRVIVSNHGILLAGTGHWQKGLCPFHSEKTPSFHVSRDRYKCFGCGARGDAIDWMRNYHQCSFKEALDLLSIETPHHATTPIIQSPYDAPLLAEMAAINQAASRFFSSRHGIDDRAEAYLADRCLGQEAKWGIGYATSSWQQLIHYLTSQGFSVDRLVECGVAAVSLGGGHYARLRDRITIPYHLPSGDIAGFTGRAIPREGSADAPRYLDPLSIGGWNKSRFLFGLHRLNPNHPNITLVEGPLDAIAMGSRYENCLSTLGCQLSAQQRDILLSLPQQNITILYDNDSAGAHGAWNAAMSLWPKKNISVCFLSDAKDPDEWIRGQGKHITRYFVEDLRLEKLTVNLKGKQVDITQLQELAKPYVADNCKHGWPQYNVLDWCMAAYPEYRGEIKDAIQQMLIDVDTLPNGTHRLKEPRIKALMRAWFKPCRKVRELHKQVG